MGGINCFFLSLLVFPLQYDIIWARFRIDMMQYYTMRDCGANYVTSLASARVAKVLWSLGAGLSAQH